MSSQKQNRYCVYCHTNTKNGKRYIGMTSQNPERRWQNGHGYDRTCFGEAVKKYGWDSFTHEILASGLTQQEACRYEIAYITEYRSNDPEHGYNVSSGGKTCDLLVGKYGEEHPNHQRVKMIDPVTKEVMRVFGAQAEAARELGISRKGITKACIGVGCATYKGYIWEYADKDYRKPENPGIGNYDHRTHFKKVLLIEPDGKERMFESVKQASERTGVNKCSISCYLNGRHKDSSGRRWCYGA